MPRNPRERVANGSSMASSNLVAACGAWVANGWPCTVATPIARYSFNTFQYMY